MTNGNNGPNGPSKKREETAARIIKAIRESNGLLTQAAAKAGMGYRTIKRYVAEFPLVKEAADEAQERVLDFAEGKLIENIKARDNTAIIFYLKTKGKHRGFVERVESTGPGGGPIEIRDTREKLLAKIDRQVKLQAACPSGAELN